MFSQRVLLSHTLAGMIADMNLKTFLKTLPIKEREPFAQRCGCTLQHLKFVAYGAKQPSEVLALNVERESGGAVPVAELKPEFADLLAESGYRAGCQCGSPPL